MNTKLINSLLFLLLACLPLSALSTQLEGKWRGVLTIQKNVSLTIGVNVTDTDKGLTLTWDSPNQGMFNRTPTSYQISENKLTFKDTSAQVEFSATLVQGVLETEFTQGKSYQMKLEQLDQEDLARLRFEHSYGGNLQINSSTHLPLVLRVAVIKGSYLAKLDSPAQKSFAIPVNDIAIDNSSLSFTSSVIKASFQGSKQDQSYIGTFSQGYDFELTLTKGLNPMSNKTSSNTELLKMAKPFVELTTNKLARHS